MERGLEKTIKNMVAEGLDIDLISRVTGKTEEEINKIKQINLDKKYKICYVYMDFEEII